jgi:cell shape-determining protein MreC
MRRPSTRSHFLFWGLLCAALLCCLVPEAHVDSVRAQAYSTLTPALKICRVSHVRVETVSVPTRIEPETPESKTEVPEGPAPEQLSERVDWLTAENLKLRYALNRARSNSSLVNYEIPRGLSAEVIARKTLWQEPFFGLDRGEADGVQMNAGVLHRGAVLGRIVATAKHASSMALLTHPGMSITARLAECRMEGVLRGARDDSDEQVCKMSVIGKEVPAKPGEHVLTSGYDGAFPPGLWLGDVIEVKKSGDVQWEVIVRPACKENLVETVHVLTGKMPDVPWPQISGSRKR